MTVTQSPGCTAVSDREAIYRLDLKEPLTGLSLIRVDVLDDGETGIPHWRDADSQAEEGRGFQIVNALAQRWGFTRERDRTCCWFEITASRTA